MSLSSPFIAMASSKLMPRKNPKIWWSVSPRCFALIMTSSSLTFALAPFLRPFNRLETSETLSETAELSANRSIVVHRLLSTAACFASASASILAYTGIVMRCLRISSHQMMKTKRRTAIQSCFLAGSQSRCACT